MKQHRVIREVGWKDVNLGLSLKIKAVVMVRKCKKHGICGTKYVKYKTSGSPAFPASVQRSKDRKQDVLFSYCLSWCFYSKKTLKILLLKNL